MLKRLIMVFCGISCIDAAAQWLPTPPVEAVPIGGKEAMEQVLETQLTLPQILLTRGWTMDATVLFRLDSAGYATDITVENVKNNAVRDEAKRLLRFMRFQKITGEYNFLTRFTFSTEKYERYIKQRRKYRPKPALPADSSFTVYTKADRSPAYFKNGDEGLSEYLASEMEYPRLAIEKSVEGTVILEFIVETNGYVTDLTVKQGVNGGCTEEALRVMKETRWAPAVADGKFVRYRMSYPIAFTLRRMTRDLPGQSFGN
jgi:TonB family protein